MSIRLLADTWDEALSTLPVSAGVFILPVPIGGIPTIVYLLAMVVTAGRVVPGSTWDDSVPPPTDGAGA
jgi:hypothetical protein